MIVTVRTTSFEWSHDPENLFHLDRASGPDGTGAVFEVPGGG
jgi:hypothetical protein